MNKIISKQKKHLGKAITTAAKVISKLLQNMKNQVKGQELKPLVLFSFCCGAFTSVQQSSIIPRQMSGNKKISIGFN